MNNTIEVEGVRSACNGRWSGIWSAIGIPSQFLKNKEGPCPKCGGVTRFRILNEQAGALFCSHCFSSRNGDGFAAISWWTGCSFPDSVKRAAEFVGVSPYSEAAPSPKNLIRWLAWNDLLIARWCDRKRPITAEALQQCGARIGRYRDRWIVVALPIWSPSSPESGWVMYNITGAMLPVYQRTNDKITTQWRKIKMLHGSQAGLIGQVGKIAAAETVWKLEGPSDVLGAISMSDCPDDVAVVTNAFGAKENPDKMPWLADLVAGKRVCVLHDCDTPGQEGATVSKRHDGSIRYGWAPALSQTASECRNVILPYPVVDTDGPDVRDWLNAGHTFASLIELAAKASLVEPAAGSSTPLEYVDDPHRLARMNLYRYEAEFGGKLRFWHEEWWRWKSGRYQRIEAGELRAKLTWAIKQDFDRCWREESKRYEEWKLSDDYAKSKDRGKPRVRKVTRSIVHNVVGALEGECGVPPSRDMPCWLPDGSNRNYLSMKNGILDLNALMSNSEDCLLQHSPEWFSRVRLDYAFDAAAKCPKFIAYLLRVLESDYERIHIVQEWAGYLLFHGNPFQKFVALEGDGRNGKTVFFAVMTAMVGQENVSNLSLERFDGRFDLGMTFGKLLNVAGDVGEIDQMAEGTLKTFTDALPITVDRKHLSHVSFRPTAKLMAAWNTRPRIRDKSEGLWRRMLLVPFRIRIDDSEIVHGMDSPQWWIQSGEMPGILNWSVLGLARLLEQNHFTRSQVCDDALARYIVESNPCREFFAQHVVESLHESIESTVVYRAYRQWCDQNGYRPLSMQHFGIELNRFFPASTRRRATWSGRPWIYEGVRLTAEI